MTVTKNMLWMLLLNLFRIGHSLEETDGEYYQWHVPYVISCRDGGGRPIQIRGLMNTGTNFLRTLLEEEEKEIVEDRKHMLPWILERRGRPKNQINLIMVRHPISWITGMKKAPYFLNCEQRDYMRFPDTKCQLNLMWKFTPSNNSQKQRKIAHRKERLDVDFSSIIDIWNQYYSAYLQWQEGCALLLRYEDLLINPKKSIQLALSNVHDKHFSAVIQRRTTYSALNKPAKTHGHSRSFESAKAFNLQKKWHSMFSQDQLNAHCKNVNATLLSFFAYTCP
mmetsp:Transcript_1621/g.2478  ORF Transcript_1621/g.2478 Transcript_1621/m.2478 type:complete len:280 (-) Transcript_1621:77-916(-)